MYCYENTKVLANKSFLISVFTRSSDNTSQTLSSTDNKQYSMYTTRTILPIVLSFALAFLYTWNISPESINENLYAIIDCRIFLTGMFETS